MGVVTKISCFMESQMNKNFYKGFEKNASPFEKLRQTIISPKNVWRGRVGAGLVALPAAAYLGFKAVDKTIGAPTPQNDI